MQVNTIRSYGYMLVLFLGVGAGTVGAQEFEPFQLEGSVFYSSFKNGVEETLIGAAATWYAQEVIGRKEPLNERAFLSHVSWGGAMVGQSEVDFGGGIELDGPQYMLAGRFVGKEGRLPVTLEAQFEGGTVETTILGPTVDIDFTSLGGRVGTWLEPNSEVGVLFETSEVTSSFTSTEVEGTVFGVYAKTVRRLNGRFVNVEAEFRNNKDEATGSPSETNTEFEIGGDYYINPGMAVGAAFTTNSGDDQSSEGKTIEVRGRYDDESMWGAELSVSSFSASNSGVDDHTIIWFSLVFRG